MCRRSVLQTHRPGSKRMIAMQARRSKPGIRMEHVGAAARSTDTWEACSTDGGGTKLKALNKAQLFPCKHLPELPMQGKFRPKLFI